MVHRDAFAQLEFGDVTPVEGFMWDEPSCPLSRTFMDDTAGIGTVGTRAPSTRVPWLLVQGIEDDVVSLQDSLHIFEMANEPKQLVRIEGAGCVFSEHMPDMSKVVPEWV